jgi:hypothetical protein
MANVSPAFGSIIPSQKQQALETNYLNFTDGFRNALLQLRRFLVNIAERSH